MNGMSRRALNNLLQYFSHYNGWWLLLQWIMLHSFCVGGTAWRDSSGQLQGPISPSFTYVLCVPQIVQVYPGPRHHMGPALRNISQFQLCTMNSPTPSCLASPLTFIGWILSPASRPLSLIGHGRAKKIPSVPHTITVLMFCKNFSTGIAWMSFVWPPLWCLWFSEEVNKLHTEQRGHNAKLVVFKVGLSHFCILSN